MSLDWQVDGVKNYKKVCWVPGDRPGTEKLNPVTESLIWATMAVGIGQITEKNHEEFFIRLHCLEQFSPFLNKVVVVGDGVPAMTKAVLRSMEDFVGRKPNPETEPCSAELHAMLEEAIKESKAQNMEHIRITLKDVRDHIGLSTNCSSKTDKQYGAYLYERLKQYAKSSLSHQRDELNTEPKEQDESTQGKS